MATLAPLASPADLPAGTTGNITKALKVASSLVREAAGVPISRVTATIKVTAAPGENLLKLPQPLQGVASVTVCGRTLDPAYYVVLPEGIWHRHGWGYEPVVVEVTCTFGYAAVPDDIIDLVAQLAVAWLQHQATGGGSTAGLTDVRLDDAAESYDSESAGTISPVYIPEKTCDWLAARFGAGVEVVSTL